MKISRISSIDRVASSKLQMAAIAHVLRPKHKRIGVRTLENCGLRRDRPEKFRLIIARDDAQAAGDEKKVGELEAKIARCFYETVTKRVMALNAVDRSGLKKYDFLVGRIEETREKGDTEEALVLEE